MTDIELTAMQIRDLVVHRDKIASAIFFEPEPPDKWLPKYSFEHTKKLSPIVLYRRHTEVQPSALVDVLGSCEAGCIGVFDIQKVLPERTGMKGPVYIYIEKPFRSTFSPGEFSSSMTWVLARNTREITDAVSERLKFSTSRMAQPLDRLLWGTNEIFDPAGMEAGEAMSTKLLASLDYHKNMRNALVAKWLRQQVVDWAVDVASGRPGSNHAHLFSRIDLRGGYPAESVRQTLFGPVVFSHAGSEITSGDRSAVAIKIDLAKGDVGVVYRVAMTKTLDERSCKSPFRNEASYAELSSPWDAIDLYSDACARVAWQEWKASLDLTMLTISIENGFGRASLPRSPLRKVIDAANSMLLRLGLGEGDLIQASQVQAIFDASKRVPIDDLPGRRPAEQDMRNDPVVAP